MREGWATWEPRTEALPHYALEFYPDRWIPACYMDTLEVLDNLLPRPRFVPDPLMGEIVCQGCAVWLAQTELLLHGGAGSAADPEA